jgi:hypothetical protein
LMRAHDSNRHGDVSVTYGARVPVVASTNEKKITSARRTIVFKESKPRVRRARARARPETYTLASAVSFTSYASYRKTYELHPQMYVSR